MLEEYFDKELKPVVERELSRLTKVKRDVASELVRAADTLKKPVLFDKSELSTFVEVPTEELIERLKRSTLGHKLLAELGDQAQDVFKELGRRYEVVGDKFTRSFRNNSKRWATGIAFVLAIALNIDSIHIADSYIKNEGLRQSIIAQNDAIINNYTALVDSLKKENKDSVTRVELEQAIGNSRKQFDVLTNLGLPLGWSYFPHSGLQKPETNDFKSRDNLGGWVMWVLGIFLTALLAGLGAPFWYDAIIGISRATQNARAIKKPNA